jgi:formylglycine-generating enzyme required for sulfatase activity
MLSRSAVAIDWVEVPAGTLVRGTPADRVDAIAKAHSDIAVQRGWIAKEAPRSELTVPAFAIARTPITVAQWRLFAAQSGRHGAAALQPADHPIDGVSWEDASSFCRWLSARAGYAVRLPTETEWERAARGDDEREYPWGNRYASGYGNLADLGIGHTTGVGSFPRGASPFGVLDLVGNVDEWTGSLYAPYLGAPPDVPAVESWAMDPHITRGGAFLHHRDLARCARRHGLYRPQVGAGFRIVRPGAEPPGGQQKPVSGDLAL